MQAYPSTITPPTVVPVLQEIARLRGQDIIDRNNFPSVFLLARKVGRIPSSSIDVIAGDKIGDMNFTKDYAYYLVDDGTGTGVWRRIAMATW